MTDRLVNILKTKLVAAELKTLGITAHDHVLAIAGRTRVDETTGALVCLDADGNVGMGSGPSYTMTIADVAKDLGATNETAQRSSAAAAVKGNPFMPGADYSLTGQMVIMRTDPVLAEDLAAAAGVSLTRNAS